MWKGRDSRIDLYRSEDGPSPAPPEGICGLDEAQTRPRRFFDVRPMVNDVTATLSSMMAVG